MAKRLVRRKRLYDEFGLKAKRWHPKGPSIIDSAFAQPKKKPVVEECSGCEHIVEGHCAAYLDPAAKWKGGWCNFTTRKTERQIQIEKKLNPLKASKRKAKGKEGK